MLGRLRLHLAGCCDERNQRQVNEDRILSADVVSELTDCLEEWQGLDVADGATDFDNHHVTLRSKSFHRRLDLVGNMRNHLNRRAEVLTAPFLRDDAEINPAGGDVVGL